MSQLLKNVLWLSLSTLPLFATAQDFQAEETREFHRNHISVFGGGTSLLGEDNDEQHTFITMGLDYEFRISRPLGISAFVEYLFPDHEELLFGVPVFLHPFGEAKFNASPLLALEHGEEAIEPMPEMDNSWHAKYGFRLEAAYDLHLGGRYSLTPTVNYDWVDKHSELNYGLALGVGF